MSMSTALIGETRLGPSSPWRPDYVFLMALRAVSRAIDTTSAPPKIDVPATEITQNSSMSALTST